MVKIIVDSTADMIPELKAQVRQVPLTVTFGDKEYIDGVTIDHKRFYEMLIESDTLPTTSQATPDGFITAIEEVLNEGNEAVIITLSSKLSGTYQSAVIAASEYEGRVYAVDSRSVAIGTGILAELALNAAESGKSAREIAEMLEKQRERVRVIALLDTLEYLKRGGRISKTTAFAGGLLSIKPVVELRDGAVEILGKARGSKQGNNLLIKEIEQSGGVDFSMPLLLGYTGLSDALLQKYIEDSAELWQGNIEELHTTAVSSVVGTHTGPGVVAAAFFKAQ